MTETTVHYGDSIARLTAALAAHREALRQLACACVWSHGVRTICVRCCALTDPTGIEAAARVQALEQACALLRDASQQSHSAHFDRTMQGGIGCPECIRARQLREQANAALARWRGTA